LSNPSALPAEMADSRSVDASADRPLLALVGPTASGKSQAGVMLARRVGAQIVSVDSMLIYRGMDVGTAKPPRHERGDVPHHLIDVVEPSEPFSVADFQRLARAAVVCIVDQGAAPLLVGGSGLYFRAVTDPLEFPGTDPLVRRELELVGQAVGSNRMHERLQAVDPRAAGKIEPGNLRRTIRAIEVVAITGRPFSEFARAWDQYGTERVRVAGVSMPREVLDARIERRIAAMLEAGFVEEVRGLVERGLDRWLTARQAIGYAEMTAYLAGRRSFEEAVADTIARTRALARRQLAWFRRDPRVRWFEVEEGGAAEAVDAIEEFLRGG
jgi:tRNA dimethylallyltransferase